MFENGSLVKDKYRIIEFMGKGNMAETYLALSESQKHFVIKVLRLKGLPEWKILELFEREAKVLQSIDHPNVPKYIDYFTDEREDDVIYFLIYEYIQGYSINSLIESGKRFSYIELENLMLQVLEILEYLHNLIPPIIHRDINPNNIILKDNKEVYLVDFGTVKQIKSNVDAESNTTFVGTYGYVPIEQLRGEAYPQSDIYALGMTAIKMLTGKNPGKFELKDLKPDYIQNRSMTSLDRVINMMIEPDMNKRPSSAKQVIELIKSNNRTVQNHRSLHTKRDYTDGLDIGENYYEDMGRIKVKTFQESISLIVSSEEKYGLSSSKTSDSTKKVLKFFAENSWALTVFGIIGLLLVGVPILIPVMLFFVLPSARRYIKKRYSEFEDVEIKIEPDRISVPNQLEPVRITKIKDINIKRNYTRDKINLKISLKLTNKEEKHFYISNLTSEESQDISNFVLRNIDARKKLLLS
jgi:serine/threonine protein kinase